MASKFKTAMSSNRTTIRNYKEQHSYWFTMFTESQSKNCIDFCSLHSSYLETLPFKLWNKTKHKEKNMQLYIMLFKGIWLFLKCIGYKHKVTLKNL